MKFVQELIDMGAPEFNVTGVAKIERISEGQVRVTYFSKRDDGNIVPLHTVWDYKAYLASQSLYDQAYVELRQEWIGRDADARAREMH